MQESNSAEGELLLFLDDDIILAPDALRKHIEAHDGSALVGFGPIGVSTRSRRGLATECTRQFSDAFYGNLAQPDVSCWPHHTHVLPNSSVPRSVIVEAGGFDERYFRAHEDTELGFRLWKRSVRFRYLADAKCEQIYTKRTGDMAREAKLDGRQQVLFARMHPEWRGISDLLPPLSPWKRHALLCCMRAPSFLLWLMSALVASLEPLHRWTLPRRVGLRVLGFGRRFIILLSAARFTGGRQNFEAEFWRQVPVLLYHHITPSGKQGLPGGLSISIEKLERQMRWLKRAGYSSISPARWLAWCEAAEPLPPKPVIITFDDAYEDLSRTAFPVLHQLGITATVFVVTAEVNGTNQWDSGHSFPSVRLLSARQLIEWSARGVDFAPHSRTHPHLQTCSAPELEEEIGGSLRELTSIIGSTSDSFAYPYGEYNSKVRTVVASHFKMAFTCEDGLNDLGIDRFQLRRTMVQGVDTLLDLKLRLLLGWSPLFECRKTLRLRTRFRALLSASMNSKQLLRKVPGLVSAYSQFRVLIELASDAVGLRTSTAFDRIHLARQWDFEQLVERERHIHTLDSMSRGLSKGQWDEALELGCSYGVFTELLASRCESVTACDCSSAALEQARVRCASYKNIRFHQLDISHARFTNQYDIIFAMDVLDYVYGRAATERVLANLKATLRENGILVLSTFRVPPSMQKHFWARAGLLGGHNLRRFCSEHLGFTVLHEEQYPPQGNGQRGYLDHIITVLQKSGKIQA